MLPAPFSLARRPVVAALMAALLSFAPAPARAQPGAPGPDEVALKDGGFVRGTIVSSEPDHEVVLLVMGSGMERTIPWAEVAGVQRGKYAVTAAPMTMTTAPQPSPVAPAEGTPGSVRVHIDTSDPNVELLLLESSATEDSAEFRVKDCRAPCDAPVDGRDGRLFRIGGNGVRLSPTFTFGTRTGNVSLRVEHGSSRRWGGGLASVILGSVAFATGGTIVALGQARSAAPRSFGEPAFDPKGLYVAGGTVAGVGGALALAGIVLMVTSRTHVSFTSPPEEKISARPLPSVARALLGGPLLTF